MSELTTLIEWADRRAEAIALIRAYTEAGRDTAMQRTLAEIRALPETTRKHPAT